MVIIACRWTDTFADNFLLHFQTPRLKHGSWSTWIQFLVILSLFDLAGALPKPLWTAREWLSTGKELTNLILTKSVNAGADFKELKTNAIFKSSFKTFTVSATLFIN